jgi:hypothetical protein
MPTAVAHSPCRAAPWREGRGKKKEREIKESKKRKKEKTRKINELTIL